MLWMLAGNTTFTTFDPTGFENCPVAVRRVPSSPTFFASGASEGGKAGEGGVSEGVSGLATGFATFTGFFWPSLKKCRPQRVGTGQLQLVLADRGYALCCRAST